MIAENRIKYHDLTLKQANIYDWLQASCQINGYPPTVREIGEAFGIRSPNGVMCHLSALESKGYISRGDNQARTIKFLKKEKMQVQQRGRGVVILNAASFLEAEEALSVGQAMVLAAEKALGHRAPQATGATEASANLQPTG